MQVEVAVYIQKGLNLFDLAKWDKEDLKKMKTQAHQTVSSPSLRFSIFFKATSNDRLNTNAQVL